ncbi:DdpA ABC-type dipeptide transport system, periplasmic component [Paracoccaceae bacterium]
MKHDQRIGYSAVAILALLSGLPAHAQEVPNPGLLVYAADDEPSTLDPAAVEPGEGGETIILQVYDRLLEFATDGPTLIPSLATEIPSIENGMISADGLTYKFPIRQGVVFHDGTPLTASDVKVSWDRAMTMALPEGNASLLSDIVASTEVVDDFTFQVTLKEPSAGFLNSVVVAMVASVISEDAIAANGGVVAGEPNLFLTDSAVGTGPYQMAAWNRNENLQLEIFDGYWGEPAKLDVRIDIGANPDIRVLGLRAGEYDVIETDPSFIADIEGAEGVNIFREGLLLEPLHIGFNLNIPEGALPPEDTIPVDFFHDPRIRQAFNYAFNYEGFINGPLGGYGAPMPHYMPIGLFGYDPEAPVYTTDLAKAEALFREAGVWDEGFSVSVITEEGNLFALMSLVLKDSIESLNPKFKINVLAVAESVFDDALVQEPLQYAMWAKNGDPAADPHAYFAAYIHPDGEWGTVHGMRNGYKNADKIAELIDQGSLELDVTKRAAIYAELQRLSFEDPMWVIGAQEGIVMAYRDYVQGFAMQPLWPRPSLKFAIFDK